MLESEPKKKDQRRKEEETRKRLDYFG